VQIDKIEWDCSKLIETMEVNAVEVQGIWDVEDEILKYAVAMWGILPKGMTKLRKRVMEHVDITRCCHLVLQWPRNHEYYISIISFY